MRNSCAQPVQTDKKFVQNAVGLYPYLREVFASPVVMHPAFAHGSQVVTPDFSTAQNRRLTAWQQWLCTVSTGPINYNNILKVLISYIIREAGGDKRSDR